MSGRLEGAKKQGPAEQRVEIRFLFAMRYHIEDDVVKGERICLINGEARITMILAYTSHARRFSTLESERMGEALSATPQEALLPYSWHISGGSGHCKGRLWDRGFRHRRHGLPVLCSSTMGGTG